MGDITNPRLIYLKGFLFLVAGVIAAALVLVEQSTLVDVLKVGVLLAVAVWCFCRFYYFAFYVIQHYVDPGYKFAGLGSFVVYLLRPKTQPPPKEKTVPLDPDIKIMLDIAIMTNLLPNASKTVEQNRASLEALMAAGAKVNAPVARVEDRTVPGPAGPIPVRVFTPEGTGPFPVLMYFHGGGWVLGTLDGYADICRSYARGAGCVVVSVDYRLAPEHKFPAAPEDCYAATLWAAENASQVGGDGRRLAVAGDSAGGNRAAAVCLMARDRGGPKIAGQVLNYPATDHHFDTPSYLQFANGSVGLSRETMMWFWRQYLPDDSQGKNPLASPLAAADLRGLPPALVITAELDVLRDEGEAYLARLREAKVSAAGVRYVGMPHGFLGYQAVLAGPRQAVRQVCDFLGGVLGRAS
jgi:acetyl esterase